MRIAVLLLSISLGLPSAAFSAPEPEATFFYLAASDLDPIASLPPSPGPTSPERLRDFAELHRLQLIRSKADCDRADYEEKVSIKRWFGDNYGPLSDAEASRAKWFFLRITIDSHHFIGQAKEHARRPRPFAVDPTLKPCIDRPGSYAYPSGHAALAWLTARVLSEALPHRRAELAARGLAIGRDRALGGVHHPSDIAAGQILGDQLFEALMKKPRFRADLQALKNSYNPTLRWLNAPLE